MILEDLLRQLWSSRLAGAACVRFTVVFMERTDRDASLLNITTVVKLLPAFDMMDTTDNS